MLLQSLMAYVVAQHYYYVRKRTPRIERRLERRVGEHGERRPELHQIRCMFAEIASEMTQNMAKEELILFSAIVRAESGNRRGSLASPVRMILLEHDYSDRDLKEIRKASSDSTPPPEAYATYCARYKALAEFEADLHQYVHLENNILLPHSLAPSSNASS